MKDLSFVKDGKTYHVVCTYLDENTNKNYMLYTDGLVNEKKQLNVYSALYISDGNDIKIMDITSNEDKKVALNMLKEVMTDMERGE